MLVFAPDSSIKTSLAASNRSCSASHCCRRLWTSGRFCSLADRVFFIAVSQANDRSLYRHDRTALAGEFPELFQSRIRTLPDYSLQSPQLFPVVDWPTMPPLLGGARARLTELPPPALEGPQADAIDHRNLCLSPLLRLVRRQSSFPYFSCCYTHAKSIQCQIRHVNR